MQRNTGTLGLCISNTSHEEVKTSICRVKVVGGINNLTTVLVSFYQVPLFLYYYTSRNLQHYHLLMWHKIVLLFSMEEDTATMLDGSA